MDDITSGAPVSDPETRRALQLDTLSAILPMERRDRLAELLTDDDVATLKHLAREGMGENTLRALASDLAYLGGLGAGRDRRGAAVAGLGEPGAEIRRAPSLGPGQARDRPAARHAGRRRGAAARRALLRSAGPHAPSTVKRRLASWGTLHRWKGQEGPFRSPSLRAALRLAVRASTRPRQRKSKRAVTRDVLDRLLDTCRSDRLADTRDLAILLWRSPPAGDAAARSRGCGSSSSATNRRSRSIRRIRDRWHCRAWRFSSAGPRPGSGRGGEGAAGRPAGRGTARMARAGRHQPRGRSSGPSTAGRRWRRGR